MIVSFNHHEEWWEDVLVMTQFMGGDGIFALRSKVPEEIVDDQRKYKFIGFGVNKDPETVLFRAEDGEEIIKQVTDF